MKKKKNNDDLLSGSLFGLGASVGCLLLRALLIFIRDLGVYY